jgi:hypothetical protein
LSFFYNTLDELEAGLEHCSVWLESIGVAVEGTRLDAIRSRLVELQRKSQEEGRGRLGRSWNQLGTSLTLADATAFSLIGQQFHQLAPHLVPKKKLKTILTGPLMVKDEDASTGEVNARNIFFELELAADLMSRGVVITGFDDVTFLFEGKCIHIECKRLHSDKAVENNVNKACSQLGNKLVSSDDLGIVALAIERVTRADERLLEIDGDQYLEAASNDLLVHFFSHHQSCLDPPINTRIIALLIVLRTIVYSAPRKLFGRAFLGPFIPFVEKQHLQGGEVALIQNLSKYLTGRGRSRSWPPTKDR